MVKYIVQTSPATLISGDIVTFDNDTHFMVNDNIYRKGDHLIRYMNENQSFLEPKIGIVGYDSMVRSPGAFGKVRNWSVDGVVYATIQELSDVLSGIIYAPLSGGSGGGGSIDVSTLAKEATLQQLIPRTFDGVNKEIEATVGGGNLVYTETDILTAIGYTGTGTEIKKLIITSVEESTEFDFRYATDDNETTRFNEYFAQNADNSPVNPFTLTIFEGTTVIIQADVYNS